MMAAEDATGLRFDDAEAAAATSVGELLALVGRGRGRTWRKILAAIVA